MGELPGQLGTNLQILSGLQGQLQSEADAINAAKQQHAYLQTLLDQYRSLQASPKTADGAPIGLPALDEELERLKSQLGDLSSRNTDRHPDVSKLKKKNESAMATSMELFQQGERFRIIDPPSLPVKPDFPNRLKFCGIGLAAGLALGAAVVAGFEMLDDRLYSEKEIQEMMPVPVIS